MVVNDSLVPPAEDQRMDIVTGPIHPSEETTGNDHLQLSEMDFGLWLLVSR